MLAKAKLALSITFIVLASFTIVTYDCQNMFIIQATGHWYPKLVHCSTSEFFSLFIEVEKKRIIWIFLFFFGLAVFRQAPANQNGWQFDLCQCHKNFFFLTIPKKCTGVFVPGELLEPSLIFLSRGKSWILAGATFSLPASLGWKG